jgi:DNA polymerase V
VQATVTADTICGLTSNCLVIQTDSGLAVIDRGLPARQGDVLLAILDGRSYFGKILGQAFITHDGDAIEGECLDELQVIGVVTHFVTDMRGGLDDDCPVI